MKAITRFAPSPTGYIHIGNVRSAIYPYLLAKQTGGKFILRIEDTDRARFVEGATELIEDTLNWLGLKWDEGPEIGGNHGPYFQTERKAFYLEWAQKLIQAGRAYADPTPPEKIDEYRNAAKSNKAAFLYRNFRPNEANQSPEATLKTWQIGKTPLRFKSEPKAYDYHDAVFGDLHLGPETQDDFILIKADGLPTYNFAHIVDDALMAVTHVIRGQEYLPSMSNYLALYDALDLTPPTFVHLPHILGPTGTKKLSKRDGAKSVTDYRADGILPEAMLNYLACLGWNDGTEQELYSLNDLLEHFRLDRIQHTSARFDEQKLLWLNGQWIRRRFAENAAKLLKETAPFWPESAKNASEEEKARIFAIVYDRLKTLSDLRAMTNYFFEDPQININFLLQNKALKKLPKDLLVNLLQQSLDRLTTLDDWSSPSLQNTLNQLLVTSAQKPAVLFGLLRLAVSFAPFSPALPDTLSVLGKNTTLARLTTTKNALNA